jgi:hypothetical protein
MIQGILHIGMPKCMSTSLQSYLREAEHIHFAGIGPSKFVRPEMLLAFQRQIVRTPTHFYNKDFVARTFGEAVREAREKELKYFALSDETIPFPLGYARADTSYVERLMRLKAVMPQPTTVIMLVRRPADYLASTYRYRAAMNGTSFSYDEYLKRLLLLGDTNLLGTAKFGHYAESARVIFGDVNVFAMEALRQDERPLLAWLGEVCPDHAVTGRLPRENAGMPAEKFANFQTLLRSYGDVLDDSDFNVMSAADRLIAQANPYYGNTLGTVVAKESMLTVLRNLAHTLPDQPPDNCFALSDDTRKLLDEYLRPSNLQLKRNFDIPTDEFGYDEF